MSNSFNMAFGYPREIEQAKKEGWAFLLPVGTMEFHGPSVPYGCDTLTAIGLCEEFAKKTKAVILPPIWYGVASWAVGGPETATINVNVDTFEQYVYDILSSLFHAGINRNIHIVLCHQTEDLLPMTLACMKAAKKLTFDYLDETKGYGWWGKNENKEFYQNLTDEDNPWKWVRFILSSSRLPEDKGVSGGDHAGKYECGMLEYLFPGTVKLERLGESDAWFIQNSVDMSVEDGKAKVEAVTRYFLANSNKIKEQEN